MSERANYTRGPWGCPGRERDQHVTIPLRSIYCERLGYSVAFVSGDWAGEPEANANLIGAATDLLEALQWREQFEPREGEDSNERFERIAAVFYRETGFLRPGKDCRVNSHEERQEAWDAWMQRGRDACRVAIAKAKGAQA
jgi:hypothetical protein